jgi:hypothetical protein
MAGRGHGLHDIPFIEIGFAGLIGVVPRKEWIDRRYIFEVYGGIGQKGK